MGAVYEALHRATGRRVAVKLLGVERHLLTPTVARRFEREARAMGALASPHIAQVLDAGADPATGERYLVMELLVGEDLATAHRQRPRFPDDLALRLGIQACVGLTSAHAAGVIHRDIKPSNLFLAWSAAGVTLKLLDFGLAKVAPEIGATKLTVSGSVQGSPRYMSPEQALGGEALDHRTDLWSLGIVLYELLAGRSPYDLSGGDLLSQICASVIPSLEQVAPWVRPELARVVHRALERDVSARFGSAAEMAGALGALAPGGHSLSETAVTAWLERPLGGAQVGAAKGGPIDLPRGQSPLAVSLVDAVTPADPRASAPVYADYVVGGEHGRGGRGRVLRANDRRLGRTVAMKEMLDDDPEQRARFLREARLTARLQHPSTVPVYELGFRSDGAPFYTMKLVTGEPLDVAIERAGSLAGRLAFLPGLLAVTEAVAFAHERRIIHRDLKPANVIVGAFGETVVIDWGWPRTSVSSLKTTAPR